VLRVHLLHGPPLDGRIQSEEAGMSEAVQVVAAVVQVVLAWLAYRYTTKDKDEQ
jgi:hypothetical protein